MAKKLLLAVVVLWEFCSPVLSVAASALQLPCFTSYLADPVYHLQDEPVYHLQDEPTPEQILAWRYERRDLRRQITPSKNISIHAYTEGYTALNGLQLQNVSTETSIIRFRIQELTELILNATQPNSTEPEVPTSDDELIEAPDASDPLVRLGTGSNSGSTNDTNTTNPTNNTDTTNSTNPTNNTDTTNSTNPTNNTDTTNSTNPTNNTDTTNSTNPTNNTDTTNSTNPTNTTNTTNPTNTTNTTNPTNTTTTPVAAVTNAVNNATAAVVNTTNQIIGNINNMLKRLSLFNEEQSEPKHAQTVNEDELTPEELEILHGQQKAVFGWRYVELEVRALARIEFPLEAPA